MAEKKLITDESAVQGSAAWLETRKKFRNASETADVMGVGFNTPNKLKRIKAGLDEVFVNAAMKRGVTLENKVREWAEEHFGTMLSPTVWEHGKYRASLDGISFDNKILTELKVSHVTYMMLMTGEIPHKYLLQIYHQMYCSPAEVGYLVAYSPDVGAYAVSEPIKFDQDLWVNVDKAWDEFDKMPVPEVEYERIVDKKFLSLEKKRIKIYNLKKKYEDELKEIDSEIKLYADGKNIEGDLIRVNYATRKGTIDYEKIVKDNNIKFKDSDYRKAGSIVASIMIKDADK